jgi:hypothetical protein
MDIERIADRVAAQADNALIARELLEVAKILDGTWIAPDANASMNDVSRQYSRIRSIPNVEQRAQVTNMVSEVAFRNRDRFGLTRRPEFRGWGRGDFLRLTKMITTAA